MALAEINVPPNRSGYRWWLLGVRILGITDANVLAMTKTVAGLIAMIAAKALPGGGYDYFQGQMQAAMNACGDLGILTSTNLTGLTTVAGVTAIFTTNDASLTSLPANSFQPVIGISYPGGPGIS